MCRQYEVIGGDTEPIRTRKTKKKSSNAPQKLQNVSDGAAGAVDKNQKDAVGATKKSGLGGQSPPERRHRVEAIEVSEFAIAFASYIEGDTGLSIITIVMAGEVSFNV